MDPEIQEKKESLLMSNHQSSLALTKIKSSLTLDEMKKIPTQFLYFYLNGDQVMPIQIDERVFSVRDAIEQGIEVLNQDHGLRLINDYKLFNLYAAKKTGKKKSDLPSLEYTQLIEKTKFQAFVIVPKPGATINQPEPKPIAPEPGSPGRKPTNGNPKSQQGSPAKANGKKESQIGYSYYMGSSDSLQLPIPRKETPPEPTVGCFCFKKRS